MLTRNRRDQMPYSRKKQGRLSCVLKQSKEFKAKETRDIEKGSDLSRTEREKCH